MSRVEIKNYLFRYKAYLVLFSLFLISIISYQNCGGFKSYQPQSIESLSSEAGVSYRWIVGQWSGCNSSCSGNETRSVVCVSSQGIDVADSLCAAVKPDTVRACSCPSASPTPRPTVAPTPRPTPSPTSSPNPTPSPTATAQPAPSPTPTSSPSPTQKPSPTPTPSPTGSLFEFTISDPNNVLGSERDLLLQNAEAAGVNWSKYINYSTQRLQVVLEVTATSTGRFAGGSLISVAIGTDSSGRQILEDCSTHKLRTGEDVNGSTPDIHIEMDPNYIATEVWLDPDPTSRTATVPNNRLDAVSLFMHELGHGLGMEGFLDRQTGAAPANYIGVYDQMVSINNGFWFNGTNAVAAYGKIVPLTSTSSTQNIYHYGDPSTATTDGLGHGLMTGNYFYYGYRYNIMPIDVGILKDVGIPMK